MKQIDKVVDIGFLLVNDNIINYNAKDNNREEYLYSLNNFEFNMDEINRFCVNYEDKELCNAQLNQAIEKVYSDKLSLKDKKSFYINYNSVNPLNKYFFLEPSIFLEYKDFKNIPQNSILKQLYRSNIGNELSDSFIVSNFKIAYESFILNKLFSSRFIMELKSYINEPLLKKIIFDQSFFNNIIVHKAL